MTAPDARARAAAAAAAAPHLELAVPILPCVDVDEVIDFYVRHLGFTREWTSGDPPTDGGVRRGDVQVFFMADATLAAQALDREVMLFVRGVDALYEEHVSRGALVDHPPRDEPWGLREYSVRDPHGHRLRFAEQSRTPVGAPGATPDAA